MRSLPVPSITVSDVLTDCIKGADITLQPRLAAIRGMLDAQENAYVSAARTASFHTLPADSSVGSVTTAELKDLYSKHMSATRGSARGFYDQIRNSAPYKRCPLCGSGTVATLDHHLPKSRYPDLSILPYNLVPACHYCNDSKKARYPKSAGEQTLHPYFDGHLQGKWLTATVDRGPPVTMVFSVLAPQGWHPVDVQRAHRHFVVFKLGILFACNATDELIPLRERLQPVWKNGGATQVKAHLAEQVDSYRLKPNSWQQALYQAVHDDPWFVGGGFQKIVD